MEIDWKAVAYIGSTLAMFLVFALIVKRTYSAKRKSETEDAKYRMMKDD